MILHKVKRIYKYIIKGEIFIDVQNGYKQRREREEILNDINDKLRYMIKNKYGDIKITDEIFKLPNSKLKVFREEYPDSYKQMLELRRKY